MNCSQRKKRIATKFKSKGIKKDKYLYEHSQTQDEIQKLNKKVELLWGREENLQGTGKKSIEERKTKKNIEALNKEIKVKNTKENEEEYHSLSDNLILKCNELHIIVEKKLGEFAKEKESNKFFKLEIAKFSQEIQKKNYISLIYSYRWKE